MKVKLPVISPARGLAVLLTKNESFSVTKHSRHSHEIPVDVREQKSRSLFVGNILAPELEIPAILSVHLRQRYVS